MRQAMTFRVGNLCRKEACDVLAEDGKVLRDITCRLHWSCQWRLCSGTEDLLFEDDAGRTAEAAKPVSEDKTVAQHASVTAKSPSPCENEEGRLDDRTRPRSGQNHLRT